MLFSTLLAAFSLIAPAVTGIHVNTSTYISEFKIMPDHDKLEDFELPRPQDYFNASHLPKSWSWGNISGLGHSKLTRSLNQHIPQYCGSCWAHAAISSLADRIKIHRGHQGTEINLSIQFILNCGSMLAGSCHGGSASGAYHFIKRRGYIPFDTCQIYTACSSDSTEGVCKYMDTKCHPETICKTCNTYSTNGGECVGLKYFPNATIAEYGKVKGEKNMMKEIYMRGPIACGINAEPTLDYKGGIFVDHNNEDKIVNHEVSIVGWGEENGQKYWIIRNSWGEYWGEMGFMRLARGTNDLAIESGCTWVTPKSWSETNVPCAEDGTGCTGHYTDPGVKYLN